MLALVELIVVGFVVLTIIYVGLSLYSRRVRRGKLRRKWQNGPRLVDMDSFVRRGLRKYDTSIRRKLILGVYIIPVCLVILIIYLTNFS
ncbi:hypothetical protein [Roseobacter sp. GAI101]|uniref:hypothetical protein n=1 Tax=Roseobacter sp. (strain GAI101) TaxID=391589 RepID=UPI000187178E|nr:hypothetical protein [Roseobacter sp. GAI101]EEB84647.1 conserved hypothetical protein [Roseobacter sp. GAI101]